MFQKDAFEFFHSIIIIIICPLTPIVEVWVQEKQKFMFAYFSPLLNHAEHITNASDVRSTLSCANKFATCNSLFVNSEPAILHAPRPSNTSKVGSFKNRLYAVHDSITTLVSSHNNFVHLRNLSDNHFERKEKIRWSNSKLYGHESGVECSVKMDQLQANMSQEYCYSAALTCFSHNTLPVSVTHVMYTMLCT